MKLFVKWALMELSYIFIKIIVLFKIASEKYRFHFLILQLQEIYHLSEDHFALT